ncbi:MAG: MFS transporter [Fervidicoccaceae archaeon]
MRRELAVLLLLGLVSLTADAAYEGARSVSGPFLESLGAAPLMAAIVGSGELLSYAMRFLGGYVAAAFMSSTVLWAIVIAGYAVNLVVVPLLAFAGRWEIAVALYLAERVGKGLRTPARETILAEVSSSIGRGKGFGIHEVLDQVGAFAGPLAVSRALNAGGYSLAFLSLSLPAAASVGLVAAAALMYPKIKSVDRGSAPSAGLRGLPRRFWLYTASSSLLLAGYIHWSIASMYIASEKLASASDIALAYSVAMAVDALVALPAGIMYDKLGLKSLTPAPLLVTLIPLFMFRSEISASLYVVGALWGVVMGLYETNMRAAVADLVEPRDRSMAYGTFGLMTGASWSAGGFVFSSLLSRESSLLLSVALVEALSLASLLWLARSDER